MAYFNTKLIARRSYGMSGWFDDVEGAVKSAASSVIDFYGKEQQAQGANAALAAQNTALTNALAAQQSSGPFGLSTTDLMIGGAAVLGAVLLLRRKK